MRRATAIFLAAALIGAADAVMAAATFEKKKKHEAMQAAIRAAKEGPQVRTEDSASAPEDTEEKGPVRQRRGMGDWLEAFRDRHYIELDTEE